MVKKLEYMNTMELREIECGVGSGRSNATFNFMQFHGIHIFEFFLPKPSFFISITSLKNSHDPSRTPIHFLQESVRFHFQDFGRQCIILADILEDLARKCLVLQDLARKCLVYEAHVQVVF